MKFLFLLFATSLCYADSISFPSDFEFGVSNAAVQVEENSQEIWNMFFNSGGGVAYKNTPLPENKINFWSHPEIDIKLAKELGVKVFRLSLDWQRVSPTPHTIDQNALNHYLEILKLIKKNNMKVMLTLMHHSEPIWLYKKNGWVSKTSSQDFIKYAKASFDILNPYVDYWLTFNEPNVYMLFTRVAGIWPTPDSSILNILNFDFYKGDFFIGLDHMAKAHNLFYAYVKKNDPSKKVGIAQNTANYKSVDIIGEYASSWAWKNMNFYFSDLVNVDFMGINYYGSEYLSWKGLVYSEETEYNDAGRAIDPQGMLLMLREFYKRYKKPIYITENGTADELDLLRPVYLVEHLKNLKKALNEKIPVLGYIQWTLTDNLEWSDGYCPKFGLVAVERDNDFKRRPRESYYIFQRIVQSHQISDDLVKMVWKKYNGAASRAETQRPMCRAEDAVTALETPRYQKLRYIDWQ